MIGVIAPNSRREAVSEFFELFKTPWEFCKAGREYDVILSVGTADFNSSSAKLVLFYSADSLGLDGAEKTTVASSAPRRVLSYQDLRFPIFKNCLVFENEVEGLEVEGEPRYHASYHRVNGRQDLIRVGYDLFAEIDELLTHGQPAQFAQTPTIDQHIAFLRRMMIQSNVDFVEIPPVPEGHSLIACLTHDIDHPALRFHRFDHAVFGMLYRATAGSAIDFLRGKISIRVMLRNIGAALRLPFVYLGWVEDFWAGFEARYAAMESGLPSTYFAIPFKGVPGNTREGNAPRLRASGYGAKEIEEPLLSIRDSGCEIATHGLNAWLDAGEAVKELHEVQMISGTEDNGIRMHWLYFDERSPTVLEEAGVAYDSSFGYRETVGFRCGTAQAFKPLNAKSLLELPLTVMDTALFYPTYLNLSQDKAVPVLRDTVSTVAEFGGCVTVNWHDRSLAPERQWHGSYEALLGDLRRRGAWFATAAQVTFWFRNRRSVTFEFDDQNRVLLGVSASKAVKSGLPGLQLQMYGPRVQEHGNAGDRSAFKWLNFREDVRIDKFSNSNARKTDACATCHS